MNAPKCKAIGCTRKTKSHSGFCWQHWDMAPKEEILTLSNKDGTKTEVKPVKMWQPDHEFDLKNQAVDFRHYTAYGVLKRMCEMFGIGSVQKALDQIKVELTGIEFRFTGWRVK